MSPRSARALAVLGVGISAMHGWPGGAPLGAKRAKRQRFPSQCLELGIVVVAKGFGVSRVSVSRVARRQWIAIVAILVVALVAFTVSRLHGVFGSNNEISRPGSDALQNTGYNPKRVLLEVFGASAAVATINYLDIHGQPQRVENVALPWSQMLTTDEPTLYADLRAQGDGDSIGCRITVNGVVTDERSAHNVNGYIACLDKTA